LEIFQAARAKALKSLLRLSEELHRKQSTHLQKVVAAVDRRFAAVQSAVLVDGALEVSN
jgi:hypothetical protein